MERGISAINEIREYVKGLQKSINGYRVNEEKMASQLKKLDEEKTNLQNEINQLQEQVKLLKLAKQ